VEHANCGKVTRHRTCCSAFGLASTYKAGDSIVIDVMNRFLASLEKLDVSQKIPTIRHHRMRSSATFRRQPKQKVLYLEGKG
jgi:hypothetical protein